MSQLHSQASSGAAAAAAAAPPSATAGGSRRIYQEDVVRAKKAGDAAQRTGSGVVLRCWQREKEEGDHADQHRDKTGMNRPLKDGEIGVFWSPSDSREIISEDEVEVVDRSLHVGDVCKKSHKDKNSCVIIDIKRKLTLEHVITRKRIDHEVPAEDVKNAIRVTRGDYVTTGDWIGVVEEVFEEALLEVSDSTELKKVYDVGFNPMPVGEVHPETHQHSYFLWEPQLSRQNRLPNKMTILDVRQTVLCINWLAMNQTLSPEEQDERPRPKRYWTTEIDKLTLVRSFADYCQAVGDRVVFRSEELAKKHGLEPTYHGPERFQVDVMHVVHSSTIVKVIWQDGTVTEEEARTLLPYINIDEYEAWPGDWVWWQGEASEPKPVIVQNMDPEERTAEIRIYGTDTIETVPVLELNVHGTDPDTFGIHRGDVVMLDKKSHGMPLPALPRVGMSEELPSPQRLQHAMGKKGVELTPKSSARSPLKMPKEPKKDEASDIDWYGVVSELHLDGAIVVTLPSGKKITTQLEKLSLLSEGFDDEYLDEDGMDIDDGMSGDYGSEYDDEAAMWLDEEGQEITERDDWEDVDGGHNAVVEIDLSETADGVPPPPPQVAEIVVAAEAPSTEATPKEASAVSNGEAVSEDWSAPPAAGQQTTASHDVAMDTDTPAPADDDADDHSETLSVALPSDDPKWSRFEILETAPADHAFFKEPTGSTSSAAYFKRIQKEFKVLQTSLPDSILVRSYEDRTDLLRVLIIGSEGTPYEDAPFVIDFHLKPTFPQEPPVAHFHSWTNGSGRVSPNLYEEGKVCLSVLGTWSGQESESWSPSKSSLLQVFVSIQGLVLVREPWFTEPAYEKLKGTEEGEVNSALYSEKAFVLARGFVRRALEQPPEGLEDELHYLYFGGEGKGRLRKVMKRCRDLIADAEEAKRRRAAQKAANGEAVAGADAAEAEAAIPTAVKESASVDGDTQANGRTFDDAISHISSGSCIVLKRHLTVLERLWQQHLDSSATAAATAAAADGETGSA